LNFLISKYASTKNVVGASIEKRTSQKDNLTVSGALFSCAYAKRGKKSV